MDESLEKLSKLVGKELDRITAKNDLTPAELEMATKAVCLLEKIKMVEEHDLDASYSMNNMRSNRYYGRYNSMNNGNSYHDYYPDRSYDYSMDRGYSGHSVKDRMIAQLESNMMDGAKSESERRVIESLISQLGSTN